MIQSMTMYNTDNMKYQYSGVTQLVYAHVFFKQTNFE